MLPQFSARAQWNLRETAYAAALRKAYAQGQAIFDLTASNPTTCGFVYDEERLLGLLHNPEFLTYEPDPRGLRHAREAVAGYYREETGVALDPSHVVLTTSTSEAYSFLFRLLCDSGDEVLVAQPSYPLFEFLADLDNIRLVPYPLFYDHGWHLDVAALRTCITARTRAIVVVQPNNPTGHFTKRAERMDLEEVCKQHGLALIVDEVFLDYRANTSSNALDSAQSFITGNHPGLTFVLSGLSKVAALPQMKAAWLVCRGPEGLLQEAMARLEVISDTFLSMNAPIQHALPGMLATRHDMQRQILARVRENLAALDDVLQQQPVVSRLVMEAGWYAVLRIPALESVEAAAIRLLETERVLVHPGHFYGLAGEGWIVVSLLPPLAEFQEGITRLAKFFRANG
ncbi:MAG TPA: pyridoxal phosphate-dependent aminotransferase [Acidobacteriaceae bacterium]|jgi:aspartate/methionine/tyrosine aminotransferase|nr:pyridoxal phosphate-dependent aminotransferase [Acidobacteriaceae bacterium]